MTTIDKHKPGSFCWIELGTTDQHAAKDFYGALFGWKPEDFPMGPSEVYTMFTLDGRVAAAGYTQKEAERAHGVPPHWNIYISVENADASAKRAAELGGTVLALPFDVMDAGRMAVVQDPTGAAFCIWQAGRSQGIAVKDVDGTLCWADLSTPDPERAGKFYSGLFGWTLEEDTHAQPGSGYLHIKNGAEHIGGIPPAAHRQPNTPPHWLAYFLTSDVDATAAKAKALGAKFHFGPETIEKVGRMAILADPQGAVSAIFQSARK